MNLLVTAHGLRFTAFVALMRKGGLEPPRVASHAPQTCASTSSATSARGLTSRLTNNTGAVQVGLRAACAEPSYFVAGLAVVAGLAAGLAAGAAGAVAPSAGE